MSQSLEIVSRIHIRRSADFLFRQTGKAEFSSVFRGQIDSFFIQISLPVTEYERAFRDPKDSAERKKTESYDSVLSVLDDSHTSRLPLSSSTSECLTGHPFLFSDASSALRLLLASRITTFRN